MRKFRKNLILFFILAAFILIVKDNYSKLMLFFKEETKLAQKTLFSNSEEKLAAHIGKDVLNYIRASVNATPTNAQIMIPPQQEPWPIIGNREFMQYFFYPRKLIHENLDKVEADPNLTHILVTWGESAGFNPQIRGWPKFFIPVRKIYLPGRQKEVQVYKIEVINTGSKNLVNFEPELERGLQPLPKLSNFKSDVRKNGLAREIVEVDGVLTEKIVAVYNTTGFDYWGIQTKILLTPSLKIRTKILTNSPDSISLVVQVRYQNGISATFSSGLNQSTNVEVLSFEDLYDKVVEFGQNLKIPISGTVIEFVGIDVGHQANIPFLEKWGVAELEKGDLDFSQVPQHNSFYYTQLATKNLVLKDFNQAISNSKLAILLDQNYLWPKIVLAQSYFKANRLEEAAETYQEIAKLDPNLAWIYFQLGQIYKVLDNEQLALENFLKAHELSPEPSWINFAIGQSYEKLGDLINAARFYREAASRNAYIFTQTGGEAQKRLNEITLAQNKIIAQKKEILRQNPKDLRANLDLANAFLITGKNDFALQIYQELSKIQSHLGIPEELKEKFSSVVDSFEGSSIGKTNLDGYRDFVKGVSGLAVDFGVGEYIQYKPEILPKGAGTVEFFWRPNKSLVEDNQKLATLIYQPGAANLTNGLFVFANSEYLSFGIFEAKTGNWHFVKTGKIQFSSQDWYQIKISFGPFGMELKINDKIFINDEFKGGIGNTPLFIGSAQGYFSDLPLPAGSFDELKFTNFQNLR